MGIDAALFGDDGRMFYYDREYNLQPPLEYSGSAWHEWKKLSGGKGFSKQELDNYLRDLIYICNHRREEIIYMGVYRKDWIRKVLNWMESLPEGCKIISRNDTQDEYFELYKKHEEKDKE